MSDFLKQMATLSAERAATASGKMRSADFDKPVVPLALGAFDVIAEIKERSPAEGDLVTTGIDRAERARRYASGGAAAISVLTEPSHFGGELEHLEEVVAAVPDSPVMRKDFLVEPVQLLEARKAGASGALLIVTMLSGQKLEEMLCCAGEHDLFVLLEVFDEHDLARASKLLERSAHRHNAERDKLLFGVNTRNLRSLAVDRRRLKKLAPLLPQASCVAESGIGRADDARQVAALGYRAALVGTALMRSDDPAELIASMREAGRAGVSA